MKKTNGSRTASGNWLGVILYMLLGAACGGVIVHFMMPMEDRGFLAFMGMFACFMLMVYLAIMLQLVLHESGHLLFGLLTGYRFVSFRVFGWMLQKSGNGLRFCRFSLAGTGGQCLMAPPEGAPEQMPVMLYHFGGAIMNLLTALVSLGLSLALPGTSYLCLFLRLMAVTGLFFAFMNGVPLRMGPVDNDGRNALALSRSTAARRAMWVQLMVNAQTARGIRLKDMPDAWFAKTAQEDPHNSMTATMEVLRCNRDMDRHAFREADVRMARCLEGDSDIPGLYRYLLVCDRMFVELLSGNRREVLDAMQTSEQRRFMKAMERYPSVMRTDYAMALLSDRDAAKAAQIKARFARMAQSYPYPGEIEAEKEYMQMADDALRTEAVPREADANGKEQNI